MRDGQTDSTSACSAVQNKPASGPNPSVTLAFFNLTDLRKLLTAKWEWSHLSGRGASGTMRGDSCNVSWTEPVV